jgi:hypothetical protein
MSQQELIGEWVLRRKQANERAVGKRAELNLHCGRLEEVVSALRSGNPQDVDFYLANRKLPSNEELSVLILELRTAEKQAEEARQQLVNLGV